MKLTVVLVHGIGNSRKNWADQIIPAIEKRLQSKLKNLLAAASPDSLEEVLVIRRVYWEGIFKDRERELRNKLDGFPKPVRAGGPWWDRSLKYVWRLFKKFQNEVITDYIGDIIGYLHPPAQRAVYAAISETLAGYISDAGSLPAEKARLTFIAHSLGTVITSDYIYEQNNPDSGVSGPKIMKEDFILDNLFTVGSPLSLFSLRFGGPEMFTKPVSVETPTGRWVNIFDEDDPVGMPLKVLNEAYNKVVLKDVLVNSGIYGISHTQYFKRASKVLDIICEKLAIDWIALNQKLSPAQVAMLYAAYDENVGVKR